MKTRIIASLLLVAFVLGGCAGLEKAPKTVATEEMPPGIYMSNEPADFSFPTSGYTVYMVGETHGNQQTKMVFQAYLQSLYKKAGLRDVVLEEDQAFETDANAYVQGSTDELVTGLCLRADILGQIREFNASLPADEKVTVHLVDLDSPLPAIYRHLAELHARLGTAGESIPFPSEEEFTNWYTDSMYKLLDDLRAAAEGQPDVLNGLDTVSLSLDWFSLGNRQDFGRPTGLSTNWGKSTAMREDVLVQNIQYVLSLLNGKPLLVFFGGAHGTKNTAMVNNPTKDFKTWTHRLIESGVSVYSLVIEGEAGTGFWRGETFPYEFTKEHQYEGPAGYRLGDGTSLISLFKTHPDLGIIYADLRTENNWNMELPTLYKNVPAGEVYDGLVIFREFTPMENACPFKTK